MSVCEPNTHETLRRRAHLAAQCAASAVAARAYIENAVLNAKYGRLDLAVLSDLRECIRVIERTVKHAEQCRLRMLRKADRQQCQAIHDKVLEAAHVAR